MNSIDPALISSYLSPSDERNLVLALFHNVENRQPLQRAMYNELAARYEQQIHTIFTHASNLGIQLQSLESYKIERCRPPCLLYREDLEQKINGIFLTALQRLIPQERTLLQQNPPPLPYLRKIWIIAHAQAEDADLTMALLQGGYVEDAYLSVINRSFFSNVDKQNLWKAKVQRYIEQVDCSVAIACQGVGLMSNPMDQLVSYAYMLRGLARHGRLTLQNAQEISLVFPDEGIHIVIQDVEF